MCEKIYAYDLFTPVKEAKEKLGNPEIIWFRGQNNSEHKLQPSLFRHSGGSEKEQELFNKYKQIAAAFDQEKAASWDTLFDMQHYGLPTRLLDWTEVYGVAIFFAFYDYLYDDDLDTAPAIYILDPLKLNLKTTGKVIIDPTNDKDFDYIKVFWESKPFQPMIPIAIDPIYRNSRLNAQRGKFTVFGNSYKFLDDDVPSSVVKIIFNRSCIEEARNFLNHANLNEFTIFPDIFGATKFIRRISKV